MAAVAAAPSRALLEALHPARKRPFCECLKIAQAKRRNLNFPRRALSSASAQLSEMEVEGESRPRWSQTPPAMKAPVPTKPRPADWAPFKCNSDPRKLDEIYQNFLGQGGETMLTEETKWLAVTHKSFDHGRRGFNDRLAFLGKRIIEVQLSLALLNTADVTKYLPDYKDPHGRQPFQHPAIDNVEVLAGKARQYFMHHKEMAKVARQYNVPSVVRWQPKDQNNLYGSGCDMVYAQVMYAIIGGIALEKGGDVANKVTKERILNSMGVRSSTQPRMEQLTQ